MMKPATAAELRWEAHRYNLAIDVLTDLRKAYRRREITADEYRMLKSKAINGDKAGAIKGLAELRRYE